MGRISFNDLIRRWILTAGVGAAPMASPLLFHGVSWAAAATASFAGMLLTALGTTVRFILPEVLQHLRQTQQQNDQHGEAMLREGNQHTEMMLLLGKMNPSAASTIDVAEVVRHIRGVGPAAPQLPIRPSAVTGPAGLTSEAAAHRYLFRGQAHRPLTLPRSEVAEEPGRPAVGRTPRRCHWPMAACPACSARWGPTADN